MDRKRTAICITAFIAVLLIVAAGIVWFYKTKARETVPPQKLELIESDAEQLVFHRYKLANVEFLAEHKDRFAPEYFFEYVSGIAGEVITNDSELSEYFESQELRLDEIRKGNEVGIQLPGVFVEEPVSVRSVQFDPVQNRALVRLDFEWFDIGYTSRERQSIIELGYNDKDQITFFREVIFSFYPERVLS